MNDSPSSRGVPGIMVIAGICAAFNLGYMCGEQVGIEKAKRSEVEPIRECVMRAVTGNEAK